MQKNKIRKKLRARTKLMITLGVLLVLIVSILLFFNLHVNPVIIEFSEATVKSITNRSVNSAVSSVLNNTNVYDDIIEISTDAEGNITAFSVKSVLVNKLGKDIGKTALQNLEILGSEGVEIPLGTLTGIPLLTGIGPDFSFKVHPIGSVSSVFSSEFVSAGINQTNHRIYMNVKATVNLIMPTASRTITTDTQILLCESIIVGKIPDTYLNSTSLDDMMNLIPD